MRLGWVDMTFKADGETHCLEAEVVGTFNRQQVQIEAVYLTGADQRINILPVLKGQQIRDIAAEVAPQARLREGGFLSEAA
jgi:hypothetical protein